jgi:hypothetical protein
MTKKLAASCLVASAVALAACGGNKEPPKTVETPPEDTTPKRKSGPVPVVQQELGSIEQRDVEKAFNKLQGPLEGCHKQGRDRVEYMAGSVKVFLRIDQAGKVKWSFFLESSLGDRETEKCILDVLGKADWPKPVGGDAEVRNGFGWDPGGERQPTSWQPDKVLSALDDAKDVKKDVDKCKGGVKGDFKVTAYVEHDDSPEATNEKPDKPTPPPKTPPKPKGKKGDKAAAGKFKAIGVAVPVKDGKEGKDAADKVDCIVEALKTLRLPSPGSYAAKVTFSL